MIDDVVLKPLTTFPDDRGFFREIVRVTDDFFQEGFGQWSHSMMYAGAAKGWHIHRIQIDWWYVACGLIRVALHDLRPNSSTYRETMEILMGDHQPSQVLRVPPGVAHGCRCLAGPAHLFYLTSKVYDKADDGKIAHDDATIGYDWTKTSPIR